MDEKLTRMVPDVFLMYNIQNKYQKLMSLFYLVEQIGQLQFFS